MSDIDELIDELAHAQMSYDASHEQGCATEADKRRIVEAKAALRAELEAAKKACGDAEIDMVSMGNAMGELEKELATARARIAELEAENRWIPVAERLPEKNDSYAVLLEDGRKSLRWYWGNPKHISPCWENTGEAMAITHWRPLPQPPHEVG